MNIVLFHSETKGSVVLTEAADGRIVLRITDAPRIADGDYAPAHVIVPGEEPSTAAEYVFEWAILKCRTDSGIEAAQRYLRQWPEGPQAEAEEIRQAQLAKDALLQTAETLNASNPPLDQLNPDELRDLIYELTDRLADEPPDSPAAEIIRLRLKLAVALLRRSGEAPGAQVSHESFAPQQSPLGYLSEEEFKRECELNEMLRRFTEEFMAETNERAAAILGGAFLDTFLEASLINFLVDDAKEVERLMAFDRPLGTYGARVSFCYCLGLIGKIVRDDLRIVGKIRNRFAHDLHASFEQEPIRSWCLSLKWHRELMMSDPPPGATVADIFQVGVNTLICHLNGIVCIARSERRKIRLWT